MTTPAPTPGNGAQNGPAPSLAKVLIPVAGIVVLAVAALFLVRSQLGTDATTAPPLPPSSTAAGGNEAVPLLAEMRVGAVLPDFQLHPFQKGSGELAASSLKSKISLINFWATWCEACMVEMPSIIKLYQGYKDRGFDVVAVDLDTNPATVLPHTMQKYGMGFNVYTDEDSQLADFFRIQAIPLSIVMDHNRKILMIENQGLDWNGSDFRAALEKWLAG